MKVVPGLSEPDRGEGRALQGGEPPEGGWRQGLPRLRWAAATARASLLTPGTALPVPPFRFRAHLTRHISSDSAPPSHWPVPRPTGGSMAQLSHRSHPGPASGLLRPMLGPPSLGSTLIPTLLSHAPNPYLAPRPSWAHLSSW